MSEKDEKWAIFWCSLLQPILLGEIEGRDTNAFLKGLTGKEMLFPDGRRGKPSLSTLRRKLRTFQREGGFKALARKPRKDHGEARSNRSAMIERAVQLKTEQARRSVQAINHFLQAEFGRTLPASTLLRHLHQAGATRKKLGVSQEPVRKRWTRDHTHDLWVGDFEHGPYVLEDGQAYLTHLCGFIDCHSRFTVEARYYLRENLDILIDSLLRAWANHGASREIYVDNAKVFQADRLEAACYALNIRLHHRPVGDPPAGGLIERFFQTVQTQFEAEVRAGDILTLEKLNRAFSAWLAVSYHQHVHSETQQTPKQRYEQGLIVIRHVDTEDILQFFMKKEERRVDPDFSDVRIEGRFFRVDARWRKDRVQVRYDPFSSLDKVFIYSLRGEYLGVGHLHQRQEGGPAPLPQPPGKPQHNYLELLLREHEAQLQAKAKGIDYRPLLSQRPWPLTEFLNKLALLLGKKGGFTAFSTHELEELHKVYNRHPALTEPLLVRAFESANHKTIPEIVSCIQQLSS